MIGVKRLAACGTVWPLGAMPDSIDCTAYLPVVG